MHPEPLLAPPFAAGRFELREVLGRGGMGQVRLALDHQLQRLVALKVLHTSDPGHQTRLLLEARCQAAIQHPNVVPVHEVGLLDGRPCIVMAWIQGSDLWDVRLRLTLNEKVKLVSQAAQGVHAAHRAGLIHRDLKPQNILVEPTEGGGWHACVTDFGLARSSSREGAEATSMGSGTLAYMSPEQLLGEQRQDARSDVFSLGCVLYALATGKPPFASEAPDAPAPADTGTEPRLLSRPPGKDGPYALRLALEAPRWPRTWNPEIPKDLETILLHALEKEPHRRYASALAFAEDLDRLLQGEPIQARRPTLGYRLGRWATRNRALAGLSACSALGLLLTATAFGWISRQAQLRALLAQQYATQAQQIEQHIRLGHMLPAHDRTPHLAWADARMKEMRLAATREGAIAQGPFAYLHGVTHLLMDRPQAARQELERAWRLGFRTPFVAQSLGEAVLECRLSDPQFQNLTGPSTPDDALAFLRQARRPGPPFLLLESRIALLEGRDDDAIAQCEMALAQSPWAYEAHLQIGQVWLNHVGRMQRIEEIRQVVSKAMERFDRAQQLAPSDPKPLLLKAQALRLLSRRQLQMGRTCDSGPVLEAIRLCDQAERLDPACVRALGERALLRSLLLLYAQPAESLEGMRDIETRMLADARRSHDLDPSQEIAQSALGWALQARGEMAFRRQAPDRAAILEASEQELRNLALRHPGNAALYKARAYVLWNRMDLQQEAGLDPRPVLRDLIATLKMSMQLLTQRGHEQGERALDHREIGERLLYLAELERLHGRLDLARASLQEGLHFIDGLESKRDLIPSLPYLKSWAHLLEAQLDVDAGLSPEPALARAEARLRGVTGGGLNQAYNRMPRFLPYHGDLLRAAAAERSGADPRPHLRQCMEAAEHRALTEPENSYPIYALVSAAILDIRHALPRGLDATKAASCLVRATARLRACEHRWWHTEPRTSLADLGGLHAALVRVMRTSAHPNLAPLLARMKEAEPRTMPMSGILHSDPRWAAWVASQSSS